MARAVCQVADPLQQALTTLTAALEKINQDMNENRVCLEGRLDRTKENQEVTIAMLRAYVAMFEAKNRKPTVAPQGGDPIHVEDPLEGERSPLCSDENDSHRGEGDFEEMLRQRGNLHFENGVNIGQGWRFKKLDLPVFDETNLGPRFNTLLPF